MAQTIRSMVPESIQITFGLVDSTPNHIQFGKMASNSEFIWSCGFQIQRHVDCISGFQIQPSLIWNLGSQIQSNVFETHGFAHLFNFSL